jgi:O-6-methylguanine DNA methyltransferase
MDEDRPTLHADWLDTPVGPMLAIADDTHLHALEFHDERVPLAELSGRKRRRRAALVSGRTTPIEQIAAELAEYFAGRSGEFRTPLALAGSAFERAVWAELVEVPLGETCSYGDIARKVATMEAVRAVAQANGANPIPIVVPCHRCIGSDGSLTGFGGGLWRKRWLLGHESRMKPFGLFAEEWK